MVNLNSLRLFDEKSRSCLENVLSLKKKRFIEAEMYERKIDFQERKIPHQFDT